MATIQTDSSMAPIDCEGPFLGNPFGDAFDVDVWNEDDARDAFNPFDTAVTVLPNSFATESTDGVSTPARLSSDNHRGHEKVLCRGGVKKPASLRRLAGRSKPFREEHPPDGHQAESNEKSTRTVRSDKSNNSTETEHGTVNQDKNVDCRTRLVRHPSASSKQPTRQRSVPSKEKSLHNLVSLLNSSISSIDDGVFGADTVASSTVSSKSSCSSNSDERRSEKNENGSTISRCDTTTLRDERKPRMKSRQTLKADLTADGKQAVSADSKQTAIATPSRDLQRDGSQRRSLNVDRTQEPKQASWQRNQPRSTTSLIQGVQKPPSFRSRRKSLDNFEGDLNQAENQQAPSGRIPTRGLNKTQSMGSRRSFKAEKTADVNQAENLIIVEEQPSKKVPVRGMHKSDSFRCRRTAKVDIDGLPEKPVSSRHNPPPAPASSPDGGGIPPRGLQRTHSTNVRRKVVRSLSMDEVDFMEATTRVRGSLPGDVQRPPRPSTGGIRPVHRARSAVGSVLTSG